MLVRDLVCESLNFPSKCQGLDFRTGLSVSDFSEHPLISTLDAYKMSMQGTSPVLDI